MADDTPHVPTLSQLRASDYSYFGQLSGYLQTIGPKTQSSLEQLAQDVQHPGGVEWEGKAGAAAINQAGLDMSVARPFTWSWEEVAASTQRWQDTLEAGTRTALDAVDDAERDGFEVGEDYSVADTHEAETEEQYEQRLALAEAHAGVIGHRVTMLVGSESRVNGELRAMSAGWGTLNFKEGGEDPTEHDPTIAGPGSDPSQEKQNGSPYDLGVTIPGTGILITGDPHDGKPQLHIPGTQWDGDNPFPVPKGSRPLPTGTAVGPNGQQYAFYSVKEYVPGSDPKNYIGGDSHVQNLADPTKDLGPLRGISLTGQQVGISQASGVYDPKTNRMVIVGNVGADGQRALWQSDPIKPGDSPNAWMNTMHQTGTFNNVGAGDRENQIVALPKGGYLLTSASNGQPVVGLTAATPEGLLNSTPQALTSPSIASTGNTPSVPYGPTITKVDVLPNGQEQVTMRVSTWPIPEGWQPPPNDPTQGPPYFPRTYTTTFNINP
ncbi:hypothetical protein MRAB57_4821 [Mycobacterium rhizamassiliense]|uniref:Uncharacterized protein n=1 Tax=Mycobacterium rhizamassiliense TaxID=1841860 RepID=A0A2U3NZT2_9MYCO|nr:hypothetical protein [Mycobacterium rhizamassiliense]SPM36978.1 hypothetical protein MRAB57_4821 [Mycobacterium rhizamassiliense]